MSKYTFLDNQFLSAIDFAFQPIVNTYTGNTLGFEALLRRHNHIGFDEIVHFFDFFYEKELLYTLDLILREKAIKKFKKLDLHNQYKLVYNIDNRVLRMPDYSPGNTDKILKQNELNTHNLCFEISERHEIQNNSSTRTILNAYRNQNYKIALDDYGSGFSCLKLLYLSEPDYIKVDRFFIHNIYKNPKKKLFVSKIIDLAHLIGAKVVAEGVENEKELLECREMHCDYVQGYFIQKPLLDIKQLKFSHEMVCVVNQKSRRKIPSDHQLIFEQMEYIEPININSYSITDVFRIFRQHKSQYFFPAVNEFDEPLGLFREENLKEYVYSTYGKDLLLNKSIGITLNDFITPCPVPEINQSVESILELFITANQIDFEGIVITENGKYVGFMNANSLLKVINEKNLAIARDQNPLTRLPGNSLINKYISKTFYDSGEYAYVYFDLNHFKSFNDVYGFRQGDRVIVLFSDVLKEVFVNRTHNFFGHIGGDDFFVGIELTSDENLNESIEKVRRAIFKFKTDVIAFYNEIDRKNNYIISANRDGNKQKFPLLSVSGAFVHLTKDRQIFSLEELDELIATQKKKAKADENHFSFFQI